MKKKSVVKLAVISSISILCIYIFSLRVETITCYKDNNSCDAATYSLLEPLKGTSFFFSDSTAVISQHYKNVLPFQIINIKRELPNQLYVYLKDEPALYSIFQEQTQTTISGVSENGSLVAVNTEVSLPVVTVTNQEMIFKDTKLSPRFHETIRTVIKSSPNKTYQLEAINYKSPTEIILRYSNLPPLIITDTVPEYALQHIEKIMYTVQGQAITQPIKEIDLRFRLPVLRTET